MLLLLCITEREKEWDINQIIQEMIQKSRHFNTFVFHLKSDRMLIDKVHILSTKGSTHPIIFELCVRLENATIISTSCKTLIGGL